MHRPSVLSRFASRSLWLLRARLGWGGQKKVLMRGGRADSGTGTPMRLAQTGLTAWGTILRANPGVPPFLLSRLFGLERSWNKSCELLPVGPASWSCNLILGTPDVSIYSSGERTRERVGARGVLPERSWGPASCSGVGCPGGTQQEGCHASVTRGQWIMRLAPCLRSRCLPHAYGSCDTSALLFKWGEHPNANNNHTADSARGLPECREVGSGMWILDSPGSSPGSTEHPLGDMGWFLCPSFPVYKMGMIKAPAHRADLSIQHVACHPE